MSKVAIKDLGEVVPRDRLKCSPDINQGNYVNKILHRHGFVDSIPGSTPSAGNPLGLKGVTLVHDSNKQLYQEIVESLVNSSTYTRWDIAYRYSVLQLTRSMSSPREEHIITAKRVLREKNLLWPRKGYSDTLRER